MASESLPQETAEPMIKAPAAATGRHEIPAEPDLAEECLRRRIRIIQNLPEAPAARRLILAQILSDKFTVCDPADAYVAMHAANPEVLLAEYRQQLADYLQQKKGAPEEAA